MRTELVIEVEGNLPEGSEDIILYICEHGKVDIDDLKEEIDVSEKSLLYALRRLLDNDIIIRKPNLLDMRRTFYDVNFDKVIPPEEMRR